ncbi:MAG: hypothetical protein LBG80_00225 [Bacteroidales bacterium]|jgi:hypothetical protein|nr:hypothetical protein [Bacteroidales bacterium]
MGFGISNQDDMLGKYLDNMKQPKQNYIEDETVNSESIDDVYNEETTISQEDVKNKKIALEASAFTASIVVETIDVAFSELVGTVAKLDSEEKKQLKADEDIKETYKDAWANYLKDKGGELSPSMLLIILTLGIYAPKIPLALDLRKIKKQNEDLSEKLEDKDEEIRQLQIKLKQEQQKRNRNGKQAG